MGWSVSAAAGIQVMTGESSLAFFLCAISDCVDCDHAVDHLPRNSDVAVWRRGRLTNRASNRAIHRPQGPLIRGFRQRRRASTHDAAAAKHECEVFACCKRLCAALSTRQFSQAIRAPYTVTSLLYLIFPHRHLGDYFDLFARRTPRNPGIRWRGPPRDCSTRPISSRLQLGVNSAVEEIMRMRRGGGIRPRDARAEDAVFLNQIPHAPLPPVGSPARHGHHEESNRSDIHDGGSLPHPLNVELVICISG